MSEINEFEPLNECDNRKDRQRNRIPEVLKKKSRKEDFNSRRNRIERGKIRSLISPLIESMTKFHYNFISRMEKKNPMKNNYATDQKLKILFTPTLKKHNSKDIKLQQFKIRIALNGRKHEN